MQMYSMRNEDKWGRITKYSNWHVCCIKLLLNPALTRWNKSSLVKTPAPFAPSTETTICIDSALVRILYLTILQIPPEMWARFLTQASAEVIITPVTKCSEPQNCTLLWNPHFPRSLDVCTVIFFHYFDIYSNIFVVIFFCHELFET